MDHDPAVRCSVCNDALDSRPVTACATCDTPIHAECRQYIGSCVRYGCAESRLEPVNEPRPSNGLPGTLWKSLSPGSLPDRCLLCQELLDADVATCLTCKLPMHEDCRDEIGGCMRYFCPEAAPVRRGAAAFVRLRIIEKTLEAFLLDGFVLCLGALMVYAGLVSGGGIVVVSLIGMLLFAMALGDLLKLEQAALHLVKLVRHPEDLPYLLETEGRYRRMMVFRPMEDGRDPWKVLVAGGLLLISVGTVMLETGWLLGGLFFGLPGIVFITLGITKTMLGRADSGFRQLCEKWRDDLEVTRLLD